MDPNQNHYDVVVVGGGAAGLSAALVLTRARRRVAVVDAGEPRNARASHRQGYLSRDGLPPAELLAAGRAEVESYGGTIVQGRVAAVAGTAPALDVTLADGAVIRARRLVVATGLVDDLPDIPLLRSRFGRDVLHCPYCHGWEVRDRRLGVLGGSPNASSYAQLVRQWTGDVVFFADGVELAADQREQLVARGIGVVDGAVTALDVEDDALRGVVVAGVGVVRRDAVFVAPRFVPNGQLLAQLGCALDENGWAITDPTGRTSTAGVWAAGNAVNPRAQLITAAGEGSAAAIALNADLVEEDVRDAVALFRLGLPLAESGT